MTAKFFILAAVVAVARAGFQYGQAPLAYAPAAYAAPSYYPVAKYSTALSAAPTLLKSAPLYTAPAITAHAAPVLATKTVVSEEYDPNPQYQYGYDVQDVLTGDSKNHFESRNGDVVQGSYSLTDSDGTRRTVDYTADPINGFNAVVRREPIAAPAIAAKSALVGAKVAAPVAYAAHAAPVAYAAHPAPIAYAAPVAKVATPIAYAAHAAPLAYSAHPAPVAYSARTYAVPVTKFIH